MTLDALGNNVRQESLNISPWETVELVNAATALGDPDKISNTKDKHKLLACLLHSRRSTRGLISPEKGFLSDVIFKIVTLFQNSVIEISLNQFKLDKIHIKVNEFVFIPL